MKDFLVRGSKQLERIKFPQIAIFLNILFENRLLEEEFIRRNFRRHSYNYESTKNFLIDIGLAKIDKKAIIPLEDLENIDIRNEKEEGKFKKYIITKIVNSNSFYKALLKSFLGEFRQEESALIFTPKLKQRLDLSGIRNFLIDFGVIRFDEGNKAYIVEKDFEDLCPAKRKANVTLVNFLRCRREEERLGKSAELKILEFERNRLARFPTLLKRIKRISDVNISAGYDILSFEETQENFPNRFIEVKAVPNEDFHFYWSKNEIEMAISQKERYYLYLLPVVRRNKFDLEKLLIISNPYKKIFENKHEWMRDIEIYSFQKSAGPQQSILL
ncbi:MAG: DUF3883 domain-containing protein [Candidatus Omnitrophica bacterium]|nr:DUF3883 domain-containing protein [Candidatus Omnitrophota bacterium]